MNKVDIGAYEQVNIARLGPGVLNAWPPIPEGSLSRLEQGAAAINNCSAKRVLDFVLAATLVLALLPPLCLLALAIMLESRGGPFFRQERYGRGKRPFMIYKFRTMRVAESTGAFTQAILGDKRLTQIGKLLRRTSIDELPQLLNVLKGDMSLVGPRPHAISMDDLFASSIPGYCDRHLVRPGMTGLAQVCGHRGPTQTPSAIRDRVGQDRAYIQDWSFWLDTKILARTPFALMHKNAL